MQPDSHGAVAFAKEKVFEREALRRGMCAVHHPEQPTSRNDEKWKAEQDKQRKEQAIANTTGLRVLAAVSAAVPVRLLKRDLLFILEKL